MHAIKSLLVVTSLLISLLASTSAVAAAAKQIALRDFFRNPVEAAHRLSPDGKHIAYLAPYEKRMNLFVKPVAGGEAQRITAETARDIAGYFWKGNDRLLFVKDFGGDENFHVVAVDRQGKNVKDLTRFDKVRADIIDDLENHPNDILVQHNRRDAKVFDVYRINVVSGNSRMVAKNPGNITEWVTDHEGRIRAARTTDGVNHTFLYRATEAQPFKTIFTTNFKESATPLFFTFDNKKIYADSNRGRDKSAIVLMDPVTGKEEQVLFEHPEVDVEGLTYSKKRKVLTAVSYVTWKTERKFLDQETQAMYQAVEAQLPGYEVRFISNNKAEDKFIVAAVSDKTRGTRHLFDKTSGKLTKIADVSPWLVESELADMKPIKYTARDGLVINGYLTLPKGKEAKNLPVVINPHGGPWHRDRWGFNPEVQFLANSGYAVLQMNFRGSTGYGRQFWESSFKQWGKKMQDDVTDGVNYLISEGIADPKKVGIYGGSYGGYTTLAGITFTPDLYAAAVDYVGVSNLFTFLNTIPPYWKPYLEVMYEMVGHPEKDKDLLTAASPALHADKIKTPLFVAQGAKDPRVNIAESDQIVEALKKRGVAVEYLVKQNEGHGFQNEENRFEFYEAMEKFLRKHLNA